jgi:hypothetical protein
MKVRLVKILTPGLLVWFSLAWLGLAFIPMLLSPSHSVSFIETNMPILILETVLCLVAIGWGVAQIRKKSHEN